MVSGVMAGGIIAAGGAFRWASAPGEGMQVLSDQARSVVEAAAAVLCVSVCLRSFGAI